jgi:hypothetical protein
MGRVRETRLTAALAYLTARFPDEFLPTLCGKAGVVRYVSVEETEEGDRYDVLVKRDNVPIILEGKTGLWQDPQQLLRYVRTVRKSYGRRPGMVIVDVGSHVSQGLSEEFDRIRSQVKPLRFTTWTQVAGICRRIVRYRKYAKQDRVAAAIAEDLLNHLEENQMITDERPEIYLRELSSRESVNLYFRHHIYKSDSKFLRSANGNLYFAPYFTQRTAEELSESNFVPVGEGISYISRIKEIQVVPMARLLEFLRAGHGVEDPKQARDLIKKGHRGPDIMLIMLGEPYLAFLSPVTKKKLGKAETRQKFTQGAMGSRSCSLEELLAASHV